MQFLYNIFIRLFIFGMNVFALFNDKAKRGILGRKQSESIVKSAFKASDKIIWMHAASLGEYEQGLPVLEKLKEKFPSHKILVTFFSPSGYENVVKKKHPADALCYLPFDTESHVKNFLSDLNIDIFFTVKYDFWYNLLSALKAKNAKVFVNSALFYENQNYFTSLGKWPVKMLRQNIDWFFHQTERSFLLAKKIGLRNGCVTGDTRFDRVKSLRNQNHEIPFIGDFKSGKKAVVFGSSWQAEEEIARILARKNKDIKLIIAPHDLKRVEHLQQIFPEAILYSQVSQMESHKISSAQILIIDSIGLLSRLYSYADVAVVGGGFHASGLHNILEAAAFGVPVFFGNQYRKNPEADALIESRGGKSFEDEEYAANFICSLFDHEELLQEMSQNAGYFVRSQPNSSELIVEKILEYEK